MSSRQGDRRRAPPGMGPNRSRSGATGGCGMRRNVWNLGTDMAVAATTAFAATVGDYVYVAGGVDTAGDAVTTCQRYHPATRTWSDMASMTASRQRYSGATAVVDDKVYCLGGFTDDYTQFVDVFDPAEGDTGAWTNGTVMAVFRSAVCAAAVGTKIYVIGGQTDFAAKLDTTSVYDTGTSLWEELAVISSERDYMSAGTIGGKVYVAGGRLDGPVASAVTQCYDPVANTWTTVASMNTARWNGGSAVVGGKLYVFGGRDATTTSMDTVEVYDPHADTWTIYNSSMPTGSRGQAAAVVRDKVYAFGGEYGTDTKLSTVQIYSAPVH